MFEGWGEYYLLVGSAAAALIGLLFVVVTLTANISRSTVEQGARYYMSPIVFHLAGVVVMSGAALVPGLERPIAAALFGAIAVIGLAYSGWVAVGMRAGQEIHPPHWSDMWFYGVAPTIIYVALLAAAVAIALGCRCATIGPALGTIAQLLVAIRNAWDLVTWLAPRAEQGEEA